MYLKNIKEFTAQWKAAMKEESAQMMSAPKLLIVQVGNNEASNRYVRNKMKDCEEVGIFCHLEKFEEGTPQTMIHQTLSSLQKMYDGVMIQLPLPAGYDNSLLNVIDKEKDVDGLKPMSKFNPCTPLGIMKYLEHCEYDLTGKNVVICGRSEIVGKPLARLMEEKNATVSLLHSHTRNHHDYYDIADLIVTAVGKPGFLNCYPIRVPVIDVGINFVDGKLVGDCINTEHRDVTPVPGGVGLLTRCALLQNTLDAAKKTQWLPD